MPHEGAAHGTSKCFICFTVHIDIASPAKVKLKLGWSKIFTKGQTTGAGISDQQYLHHNIMGLSEETWRDEETYHAHALLICTH